MSSKKIKNKFRYSLFDNLFFMIKKAIHLDHQLVLLSLLQIPIVVLLPLCSTYLSRSVIMLITNDATLSQLIANISGFIVALLVFNLLKRMLETKIHWRSFRNRFAYLNLCSEKIMNMDYDHIEDPDGQTKMQKAKNGLYSLNGGIQNVFGQFVSICSNIIGLCSYSFLIIYVNPWLVVILWALTIANYFINRANRYWTHRNKDNWVPIDRKLTYINTKIGDFRCSKDIRLYGMSN